MDNPRLRKQHTCCDYFSFSNWFNIYEGKGRATCLVDMMTWLFQDFRVPQKLTSDGSPQFMSDKLQSCLRQYGLHQRLTSVGRTCKHKSRARSKVRGCEGKMYKVSVTRAWLTYRNYLYRDTGLSPAYMLIGQPLKDFFPLNSPHTRTRQHQ